MLSAATQLTGNTQTVFALKPYGGKKCIKQVNQRITFSLFSPNTKLSFPWGHSIKPATHFLGTWAASHSFPQN